MHFMPLDLISICDPFLSCIERELSMLKKKKKKETLNRESEWKHLINPFNDELEFRQMLPLILESHNPLFVPSISFEICIMAKE